MLQTTNLQDAYTAGFYDGEGCFEVNVRKHPNGTQYSQLRVRAAQTKPGIIFKLQSEYGGNVFKTVSTNIKWADSYELSHSSQLARDLISKIEPYSIVKKPQIELAKEYISFFDSQDSFRKSQDFFDKGIEFNQRMKALNSQVTNYVMSKEIELDSTKEITEELKAYLAGFTDAEGCIGISHSKGRNGFDDNTQLVVQLTQCNPTVLEFIKTFTGGTSVTQKINENNKKHSNCSKLTLTGSKAFTFLNLIKDYCFIKRDQVNLGIAYFNFKSLPKEQTTHLVPTTQGKKIRKRLQSTIKKEIRFAENMRDLNKRGK